MALVHDDEIKEVRIKELAVMFLVVVPDQLLIQGKIDLVRCDRIFLIFCEVDLMYDLLKRCKVLLDRVVDQVITVCEVQDLPLYSAREKPVHDLKSGIGLSGSCCHDEQDPVLSPCDGI